jgi:phosphate transport system ATP-binding protein
MNAKIKIEDVDYFYGKRHVLKRINLAVSEHQILVIIGPASSGKTTLLRTINRLDEEIEQTRMGGRILLDDADIRTMDLCGLRKKIGMIFANPVVLPGSIFFNLTYGPKLWGVHNRRRLLELVEWSLKRAILWDEVKDRLHDSVSSLSGGQQQRLCIARTLANEPEVILMDEPCSGLDPISTTKIEEAMRELKKDYTILMVTNNTKQAARVGDQVAFFLDGELIEYGTPVQLFTAPKDARTDDYIRGRFG